MVWPIMALQHSQKPNLKGLILGTRTAESFRGPSPVGLRRLWRAHYRQHARSFTIRAIVRHRFLLEDNVLAANRADHRSERLAIGFQKAVKAHHAPAAYWNPDFLGIVCTHRPITPSKWAKYIPETRCSANHACGRKAPLRAGSA